MKPPRVDDANQWQVFRHITLPLITPVIFFNLIMQSVQAFQEFNGTLHHHQWWSAEIHIPATALHL